MVEGVDPQFRPTKVFFVARRWHHPVIHERQVRIIDLHKKAGVENGRVLDSERLGHGVDVFLVGS